jgi:alcohol dehydrogenase
VLDSLGGKNLERSLRVLRPGGKVIGIAGPPDPAFARELGANAVLRLAMTVLSSRIRRQARRLGVNRASDAVAGSGRHPRQGRPQQELTNAIPRQRNQESRRP